MRFFCLITYQLLLSCVAASRLRGSYDDAVLVSSSDHPDASSARRKLGMMDNQSVSGQPMGKPFDLVDQDPVYDVPTPNPTPQQLLSPSQIADLLQPPETPQPVLSTPQPTEEEIAQQAPPQATPSNSKADNWLSAHNSRRSRLHLENGVSYVPLVWSDSVAASAQSYAELLIDSFDNCGIQHGLDDSTYGENLAANWGTSGSARSPEDVLTAWFENEENVSTLYERLHYTQVGWRATKHLGCGEASKRIVRNNGQVLYCYVQACRYVRPGNCNINQNNWQEVMLGRDSPCPPFCPPEGC